MRYVKDFLNWFNTKEFFGIMWEIIIVAICIIPVAIITTVIGMSDYGKAITLLIIGLPFGLFLENRRRKNFSN